MFLTLSAVPVAAFLFVMLFLQGTMKDAVVFLMLGLAVLDTQKMLTNLR